MKPENSTDPALSVLLRDWKVDASLPPRFGDEVWQRIARQDRPTTSSWDAINGWLQRVFARPSIVIAYATVLLLAGLTAGYWHGHTSSEREMATYGARYVQMVDPYQRAH